MVDEIKIRAATPDDAPALLKIYAPYVKNTSITYEYDVPSEEEFRRRIESTLRRYPYLVLEREGDILGYAYAVRFIRARRMIGRLRHRSISIRMRAAVGLAESCTTRSKPCCASRAFST